MNFLIFLRALLVIIRYPRSRETIREITYLLVVVLLVEILPVLLGALKVFTGSG